MYMVNSNATHTQKKIFLRSIIHMLMIELEWIHMKVSRES